MAYKVVVNGPEGMQSFNGVALPKETQSGRHLSLVFSESPLNVKLVPIEGATVHITEEDE